MKARPPFSNADRGVQGPRSNGPAHQAAIKGLGSERHEPVIAAKLEVSTVWDCTPASDAPACFAIRMQEFC